MHQSKIHKFIGPDAYYHITPDLEITSKFFRFLSLYFPERQLL